jgi:pimeloyl-ACP methyl ester carboxylesterase
MKNKLFCLLFSLGCLAACQPPGGPVEEKLNLRYKGADMPVWVCGNLESRKILLFLHGGPGECGMCLRPYFSRIESSIAVAYWDQRMAGSASGNGQAADLNYPQFADDLLKVVTLLKTQYPDASIYLLGHSFGVEMAWQFLTTADYQQLVNGFIALDGTFSTWHWLQQVQQWILREAREQGDTEAENYIKNIQLDPQRLSEQIQWGEWYQRMFRLGANPVWPSDDAGYLRRQWLTSPHAQPSQITNTQLYDNYYKQEIFNFNRRDQLKNVQVPVAIFWGAQDGIMPVEHAWETRDLLTTSTEVVIFEKSWHTAFHTETEKFAEKLLEFVSKN